MKAAKEISLQVATPPVTDQSPFQTRQSPKPPQSIKSQSQIITQQLLEMTTSSKPQEDPLSTNPIISEQASHANYDERTKPVE